MTIENALKKIKEFASAELEAGRLGVVAILKDIEQEIEGEFVGPYCPMNSSSNQVCLHLVAPDKDCPRAKSHAMKINAIKVLRELTNLGLVDAKIAIETCFKNPTQPLLVLYKDDQARVRPSKS